MRSFRLLPICLWLFLHLTVSAQTPRAVPDGSSPDDQRLRELRTLNSYFPFQPVDSQDHWMTRSETIRRHVQVATGLWPPPRKTPMNPVVHGKVERENYSVERVLFESFPGHFVTGSLYRPRGKPGKRPAVLTPHGHWSNGRFYDAGKDAVVRDISIGAERFEDGGRFPLQARCVQLARMGCVVFHYDMVGYADSVQLTHRPGVRDHMNTKEEWGYFSPQAELRMQNMMGLQTWNSIRSFDFLSSLPDVDATRIAVTGASGGGTQTFVLAAVDPRPAVLFPAVMVSTAMQGGCTCENACYLRTRAGNIDIAALAAPRPLGLTGANDWTKEIGSKGLPDLKKLYTLLGTPNNVQATPLVHFDHNYNSVSRSVMYQWVNHHLKLGFKVPIIETEYLPLSRDELTVWTGEHKRPTGEQVGDHHERQLVAWIERDNQEQMAKLAPTNAANHKTFREIVGGGFDVLLGRRYGDAGPIEYDLTTKKERDNHLLMTGTVTLSRHGEQLPTLHFYPKNNWNKEVVLWLTDRGKSGLLDQEGQPRSGVATLLRSGYAVSSVDLFGQGEFHDGPLKQQRLVDAGSGNWRKYAGYTFGYNDSLFSQRVHDVLTMFEFTLTDEHKAEKVHLVSAGKEVGAIGLAAIAQSDGQVSSAAIDLAGSDFSSVTRLDDVSFLPGAVKYGGLGNLLALAAPSRVMITECNHSTAGSAGYDATGTSNHLVVVPNNQFENRLLDWMKN